MFNRYVDGLGTWAPAQMRQCPEMGERMAHVGYGNPDLIKELFFKYVMYPGSCESRNLFVLRHYLGFCKHQLVMRGGSAHW